MLRAVGGLIRNGGFFVSFFFPFVLLLLAMGGDAGGERELLQLMEGVGFFLPFVFDLKKFLMGLVTLGVVGGEGGRGMEAAIPPSKKWFTALQRRVKQGS